jgi:glutaconate CoA-transferase subunit B
MRGADGSTSCSSAPLRSTAEATRTSPPPAAWPSHQSRRNLVSRVQIASTTDPRRRIRLLTNLGIFELGSGGATLLSRHAGVDAAVIREQTGFEFTPTDPLPVTPEPDLEHVHAIRSIDDQRLCERIVG